MPVKPTPTQIRDGMVAETRRLFGIVRQASDYETGCNVLGREIESLQRFGLVTGWGTLKGIDGRMETFELHLSSLGGFAYLYCGPTGKVLSGGVEFQG